MENGAEWATPPDPLAIGPAWTTPKGPIDYQIGVFESDGNCVASGIEGQLDRKDPKVTKKALYKVYIVDPEGDGILLDGESVVAKSADSAQYKALRLIDFEDDPDDLDIAVLHVMDLREREKVQEVRIIDDD